MSEPFYYVPLGKHHSITFDNGIETKNTWEDWHLVSEERPSFKPPSQNLNMVSVPGLNGVIDLTDSLTGYPTFANRTGSLKFTILNDHFEWYDISTQMMEFLTRGRIKAILEDDKEWYYEGRFYVNDFTSASPRSNITLQYNLDPFKWRPTLSDDEWEWDPFNFYTGIIQTRGFKDITVNSTEFVKKTFTSKFINSFAAFVPTIKIKDSSGGITIRFVNPNLGIDQTYTFQNGNTENPNFIVWGHKDVDFYFKGNGKVSISFRSGRL